MHKRRRMGETETPPSLPQQSPPPPPPSTDQLQPTTTEEAPSPPPSAPPPPPFDPSRMVGIIKRKALIKDLATAYHSECLKYCRELLELQRKWEEPCTDVRTPEEPRKEIMRQPKRPKKTR